MASFLKRMFGGGAGSQAETGPYAPLYAAIVAEGRRAHWYATGAVPDTLDGRFDMLSTTLSLVLLRLEADGGPGREPAARVTELFITDMDGQLRQSGIGDLVVGKHIGRMMSQLGGRTAAYRDGLAPGGDLAGAIARNLYRGAEVPAEAAAYVEVELRTLAARMAAIDLSTILSGTING